MREHSTRTFVRRWSQKAPGRQSGNFARSLAGKDGLRPIPGIESRSNLSLWITRSSLWMIWARFGLEATQQVVQLEIELLGTLQTRTIYPV